MVNQENEQAIEMLVSKQLQASGMVELAIVMTDCSDKSQAIQALIRRVTNKNPALNSIGKFEAIMEELRHVAVDLDVISSGDIQ